MPMKLPTREEGRRPSASMAGLADEERARIQKMTSIERMTLALRMGRVLRELAKGKSARG